MRSNAGCVGDFESGHGRREFPRRAEETADVRTQEEFSQAKIRREARDEDGSEENPKIMAGE